MKEEKIYGGYTLVEYIAEIKKAVKEAEDNDLIDLHERNWDKMYELKRKGQKDTQEWALCYLWHLITFKEIHDREIVCCK